MAVKARKIVAAAVFADCGKCGEELTSADGSLQLETAISGSVFRCKSCGAYNRLGKTARID